MSLVAYASSDEESNSSDFDENREAEVPNDHGALPKEDEVEEWNIAKEEVKPSKGEDFVLPKPKQSNEISNSLARKTGLASLLPKPQNVDNLERETSGLKDVSRDGKLVPNLETMTEDDEEILEVEEEYEPISKRAKKIIKGESDDKPKSVGSLFSLLPAPWQAENPWQKQDNTKRKTGSGSAEDRKSKQLIKIAIPTAPKTDSDEEDDAPTTKKIIAPSEGGSGLKSLLPKPKHSITLKADNPNKPSVKLASRPLVPHTLTKKATAASKKPQKSTKKNQAEGSISDDEDDEVVESFFTFSDKSDNEKITTVDLNTGSNDVKLRESRVEVQSAPRELTFDGNLPSNVTIPQSSVTRSSEITQSRMMDEPHAQTDYESVENMKTDEMATRTYYYEQQEPVKNQQYGDGGISTDHQANYSYGIGASAGTESYYDQGTESCTYTYPAGAVGQTHHQPQETNIDLEKLQKLTGRRNRHEEINIVDVNADDQIGNAAEMMAKYGTEEVIHTSSRKKKDMPTAQQRRKHQITYLAFQAKEREFELRQQWSANRQTRRQTQSKYGF
ncbi:proline-rich protein PRCC-like [Montipora foliosa]|uniref:proline-rich protein PRCC-like n=1 Tax=Montipora foliosa TaxID=591990 RepID=UPI0035F14F52